MASTRTALESAARVCLQTSRPEYFMVRSEDAKRLRHDEVQSAAKNRRRVEAYSSIILMAAVGYVPFFSIQRLLLKLI